MSITDENHATGLRQDSLFAELPHSQMARLLGRSQSVEFLAGDSIYAKDTTAEFLYLIVEGKVQITTPGGRVDSLRGLRCGEEAASDLPTYLCSATAITPVKSIRIPHAVLTELASATPALRTRALLGLAEELSGEKLQTTALPFKVSKKTISIREPAGWSCVIVLPPAIYFLSSGAGLIVEAALFLAILTATVLMWLFKLTDEFVPPFLAIAALLIVGLVPPQVALGGFSSPTLTILVGVYALALVISTSGLSYRFMLWSLIRLPATPFWHQTALLISGYMLSPIMPSQNARLSLTLPLAFYSSWSAPAHLIGTRFLRPGLRRFCWPVYYLWAWSVKGISGKNRLADDIFPAWRGRPVAHDYLFEAGNCTG